MYESALKMHGDQEQRVKNPIRSFCKSLVRRIHPQQRQRAAGSRRFCYRKCAHRNLRASTSGDKLRRPTGDI